MKVFCFGDSNTYGYDPRSYFGSRYPADCRWVDLLAEKLDCTAVNAGENGREIPGRKGQIHSFEQLLRHEQPVDLLIIMLGSNDLLQGDTAEATAGRMEWFLPQIELDAGKILLIAPPPMQLGEWVTEQSLITASTELSCKYKAVAERLGVLFADAGEWTIPLAYDGVHFTEEGHEAFAEELVNYLKKEMESCWKLV